MRPRDALRRAAQELYLRTDAAALDLMLRTEHVASSESVARAVPPPRPAGSSLTVGWVMVPPSGGSGGHTTAFRMIEALERAGHRCVVLLYDPVGDDLERRRRVIRSAWPQVRAEVLDGRRGMGGVDALVATSWQTAHAVATLAREPVHRLYFVQDFEPYFYPRGSEYELALDTYRFGFRHIALGDMVADELRANLGDEPSVVPFGCDTSVYRLLDAGAPRDGVVLYARPGPARRGYLLARLALERFHRAVPDCPIHVYGGTPTGLCVPHVDHGRLSPPALNELYNAVVAGIALSFTNISLVAEEMLAAGCLPVVNDLPGARADLDNPLVTWVRPTPQGLADGLVAVVRAEDRLGRAARAAASASGRSWAATQAGLVSIVEEEVYGRR